VLLTVLAAISTPSRHMTSRNVVTACVFVILMTGVANAYPMRAHGQSRSAGEGAIVPYMGLLTYSTEQGVLPSSFTGAVLGLSVVSTYRRFEWILLDGNLVNWSGTLQYGVGLGAAGKLGGGEMSATSLGVLAAYSTTSHGREAPFLGIVLRHGRWAGRGVTAQVRFDQSLRDNEVNRVFFAIGKRIP
jgi:hypothetical protein